MWWVSEIHVFKLLLWYLLVNALVFSIMDTYIIKDQVYYESYMAQFSEQQIASLLAYKSRYNIVVIFLFSILELLKFLCATCILWTGVYLFNRELSFLKLFKVVIAANYIFLLVSIIKVIWFSVYTDASLTEIQSFYPLSMLSLIGSTDVDKLWIYPLQILNLFELGYMFLLARGISFYLSEDYDFSLRIVFSSYLPSLCIWVIFLLYLFVVLTP